MKVLDILTEAPDEKKLATMKNRLAKQKASAPVASASPTGGVGTTPASIKGAKPDPKWTNWFSKKGRALRLRNKRIDRMVESRMEGYGTPLKAFFRIVGLLGPTIQLYTDLETLDAAYKEGNDEELQNAEQLEAARRAAWGTWVIAATASVVWMMKAGKISLWIAKIVRYAAAGAGVASGVGAAAAVAGMLATEAAFAWFENFLQSDAGKEWLLDGFLAPVVIAGGTIADSIWSTLSGYYKQANQGKADVAQAQGKEVNPQDYNKDANDRYIDGILVTTPDGQIDSKAVQHPKVQLAIANAKAAGKPYDIPSLIAADPLNKDKVGKTNAPADKPTAGPAPATSAPGAAPTGSAYRPVIVY